ncbi:Alpha/Beta hydrolase protein [Diplogelasinospora grovesii]|uniref:Alpha/Beta hydrolase protein n=1 Tax=Diplogelasinospora grovesii TaxID=303347 RepID=A0AAN6MXP2_9PEZI|nr:Alpha/Beta hydrolase protein [Diplogelasinospora grovesii]
MPSGASNQEPLHTDEQQQDHDDTNSLKHETPTLLSKICYAGHVYGLQGFVSSMVWLRDWKEYLYPPNGGPNIVKTYECRPTLPVRIFFPASYDQTSPNTLPTLFTIHGGGFCIGHIRDDDEWNRAFADGQDVLVVSLNYSKAPQAPFPTALHDVEALILAVLDDESLPIDRTEHSAKGQGVGRLSRTAVLGFSAGGNLALSVTQLPSIRTHANAPAAAMSVYGCLDLSVAPRDKLPNRPFKPKLPPPRGDSVDALIKLIPTFDWSYIPYGHDLRDPLLSPAHAQREDLPPFVGIVAAELDVLAHESWRLACRLSSRREVPDRESNDPAWRVCGRQEISSSRPGKLELDDQRFAFEDTRGNDRGGVKWLLVPDVTHGFDNPHIRSLMAAGEVNTIKDAEQKTTAYVDEMGRWLKRTVWRL